MRAVWLTLLVGCLSDRDGDGVRSGQDCDDADPARFPGAIESCDGRDEDCDGVVPAEELDVDGDGYVGCAFLESDWRGSSAIEGGRDCDDEDAERFPGAPEQCNGLSDACDEDPPRRERDLDGDGYVGCDTDGPWTGPAWLRDGDCDDHDAGVHPDAVEACDGLDGDCDGAAELDVDGDGYVACVPVGAWEGPDGVSPGDCDDTRPEVHPGAPEVCDGLDDDCVDGPAYEEQDRDRDGVVSCDVVAGAPVPGGDCDDDRPEALPGAPEVCNGHDDDCDGFPSPGELDYDRDGYVACHITVGWSGWPILGDDDCNDFFLQVHPGADEALDGVDTNCDGIVRDAESDDDGDGYVEMLVGLGWLGSTLGGDCDDTDPDVSPGAVEACDGVDTTCDGVLGPLEVDDDGDGFVECDTSQWQGVPAPLGLDCDDVHADVSPIGVEVCDGEDDDCDGLVDEADPDIDPGSLRTFWRDDDRDDYGVEGDSRVACRLPEGYAPAPFDCDDAARATSPAARETCNGFDDDCDGLVDDDDPSLLPELALDWFEDRDGDGQGDPGSVGLTQCDAPGWRWAVGDDDCDDGDPDVFLGAPEQCDGVDTDCDGHPDHPEGTVDGLGCDLCDADGPADPALVVTETWNPCVLDPDAESLCGPEGADTHTEGHRLSQVAVRTDVTTWRPELYLHIPPSDGVHNVAVMRWAATAGFRSVLLSTATEVDLADVCDFDDASCRDPFLYEAMYGGDFSPHLEIGLDDGIDDRLATLLGHLAAVHPEQGWDGYLTDTGDVAWDHVIVGAWSKGVSHAVFVSDQYDVAGMVMFSGPTDPPPGSVHSPPCRNFGVYHRDERDEPVDDFEDGFRAMGMDGPTQDLDAAPYPWPGDPQLFTTGTWHYELTDCTPHKAVNYDGCMDEGRYGPALIDLFCRAGEVDAETCPRP